jgi:cholera toxin transcriptional activator
MHGRATVPQSTNQRSIFRFGLYELDSSTGELRKDGKLRPRIQGQPLEVLFHLVNNPGDVVTREELRAMLWPADTFVDYDHSLNTAVNKLRETLGDSAENPRFIQTIPRRGYRFIAPVDVVADGTPQSAEAKKGNGPGPEAPATASNEKHSLALSDGRDLPGAPHRVVQILFSLIQIMYLCFYVIALARLHWVEPLLAQVVQHPGWLFELIIATALIGIPVRLYLLSAALFGYRGLPANFLRLFPFVFPLDELWALAPFLAVEVIGVGASLAVMAALVYLPFSQRSLMLMGEIAPKHPQNI